MPSFISMNSTKYIIFCSSRHARVYFCEYECPRICGRRQCESRHKNHCFFRFCACYSCSCFQRGETYLPKNDRLFSDDREFVWDDVVLFYDFFSFAPELGRESIDHESIDTTRDKRREKYHPRSLWSHHSTSCERN